MPDAILIQLPQVDFPRFLGLAEEMFGRNLAAEADASPRELSDTARFLHCLAALRGTSITPKLYQHVSVSALIAADEREMLEILECAGMPFLVADTRLRGMQAAIVSGTLAQWRDAVVSGSGSNDESIQACWNKLFVLFQQEGLNLWPDYQVRPTGKLFYLTAQ